MLDSRCGEGRDENKEWIIQTCKEHRLNKEIIQFGVDDGGYKEGA